MDILPTTSLRVLLFTLVLFAYSESSSANLISAVKSFVEWKASTTKSKVESLAVKLNNEYVELLDNVLVTVTKGKVADAPSYTHFFLYTSDSGDNYTAVNIDDKESWIEAGFNTSKPTKILIHGWLAQLGLNNDFIVTVRKALFEALDVNLIVVIWTKMSFTPYSVASTAVPYLGKYIASLIEFLVQDVGVDIDSFHVIGFSMGAHAAGVAGESITCGKLSWITGLDPAGPLYYSGNSTLHKLDASDGVFVDVVHTCGGFLGHLGSLGTVDFYPNGGTPVQPGCLELACSHGKAYQFYAESISSKGFVATSCGSYKSYEKGECKNNATAVMGYHVDKTSTKGDYYLTTNACGPYAKGACALDRLT